MTETDIFRTAGYEYGGQVHVDREFIEESEFDDLLVQNTVLISISSALWDDLPGREYEAPVAYGRDDMRFVMPASPGDTLYLKAEVTDKRVREKDLDAGRDRSLITVHEELINQDDELEMVNDYLSLLPFSPSFSPRE